MRLILSLLAVLAAPLSAQASETVAFLGLHLEDSSSQTTQAMSLYADGPSEEDLARVAMLEDQLAQAFIARGYTLLDLAPVADELERTTNPANRYGCDLRMAKKLDADFVLVGEVNKVSISLVSIGVQLRDAETGNVVKGGSVSMYGSDEATLTRGMRQILKNRIFKEEK